MTVNQLMALPKYSKQLGLQRMEFLCADILNSDWSDNIDPINVVGTNGKGSTTAIIAAILTELGLKTGRYISPHLFQFNERITIDGKFISAQELQKQLFHFSRQYQDFEYQYPHQKIIAFEAFTSIALHHFAAKQVEAVVLEAGIGGRNDASKIMTGNFAALTSVDLEHTKLLGDTLAAIAKDKIDILSTGGELIVGNIDKALLPVIEDYGSENEVTITSIQSSTEIDFLYFQPTQMSLDFKVEELIFKDIHTNLVGDHQVSNILTALLLLKKWLAHNYPEKEGQTVIEATRKALRQLHWPGRFEQVQAQPRVFIDVAHTPQAIDYLVDTVLEVKENPILLIVGVSMNKAIAPIVTKLASVADAIICTRAYHRGAEVVQLWEILTNEIDRNIPIFSIDTIEEAVEGGVQFAKQNEMDVLIAGGLFLAIEARVVLEGNDPKQLNFF